GSAIPAGPPGVVKGHRRAHANPGVRAGAEHALASDVGVGHHLYRERRPHPGHDLRLEAQVPTLVGTAFPVEIAGTVGTFHLDLSGIPEAPFVIPSVGVNGLLRLSGAYAGTIDGAGNVSIPDVAVSFTVILGTDVPVDGTALLSTGIAADTT